MTIKPFALCQIFSPDWINIICSGSTYYLKHNLIMHNITCPGEQITPVFSLAYWDCLFWVKVTSKRIWHWETFPSVYCCSLSQTKHLQLDQFRKSYVCDVCDTKAPNKSHTRRLSRLWLLWTEINRSLSFDRVLSSQTTKLNMCCCHRSTVSQ